MSIGLRRMLQIVLVAAITAQTSALAAGAAPFVEKVEPPNWWPGHSVNPVRVLVRGRNLTGAQVAARQRDLRVGRVKANAAGTSLFFDLEIARSARPGPRLISVVTASGKADLPFEISAPLERAGRFRGFSPDDLIYLVMPDRFANGDPSIDDPPVAPGLLDRSKARFYHGGDLQGIVDHLPYLKELGVTALWLNPYYDNVNHLNRREQYDGQPITDYHGYGAVDFYGVEEHFGTMAKLRELVDRAHTLGIKVIQDQVANHTGPYHPWVEDPPTPTWFNGTAEKHLANTWQVWTLADPSASYELQQATLQGWFIDILPDLNQMDEEVARYITQNTLWWIGMTGIDGIRQDTFPYVPRRFWRDWMGAIKREYPAFTVVGETWDGDASLVSFFQGGQARFDGIDTRLDSLFDFPLMYPVRRAFAEGGSIREVAQALSRDHLYANASMLVTFLGLHDLPRFMNEKGATIEGLRLAFTFLMTTRGIPLVYYGDEIAMPGGGDPDNRRDFPGGWPGDPRSAFLPSGRTPAEESVHAHVTALGRLRAGSAALRRGTLVNLLAMDQTYAYGRVLGSERVLVVIHNARAAEDVQIPLRAIPVSDGTTLRDALAAGPDGKVDAGRLLVRMDPRSAVVYLLPR